jgi:formylglycine-generating enzyme required for sulfatase activity/protocatechuate 3,4-dioxygenase beta subunit
MKPHQSRNIGQFQKGKIMFNSKSLRIMTILVVVMLAADCLCSSENEGDGIKMGFVRIPAGSFYMGSPSSEEDREDNEEPVHEVHITRPFYMGKYEVTQAQWKSVMGTTLTQQQDKANSPWRLKGEGSEYPMYYVSWEEAVEFCKRLGDDFRLPTEAEWEYACRAGSQTRFYYGDDPNYSELGQYSWYFGNSNNETHLVGQKKPNAWGLYGMYGNVSEWCSDRYIFNSNYENAGKVDPTGPASVEDSLRVYRGGNWLEKPKGCRSSNREGFMQGVGYDLIGFRVVYTGRMRGGDEALEIALPVKDATVAVTSNKESKGRHHTIAGMVRDESGIPIDDVDMWIIPIRDWILRDYAEGLFEISWSPSDPNTRIQGYHFIARHEQRNLAVGVEIEEDMNTLEIRLKPGVILDGKVVDPDGKGIEGATVAVIKLQTPDWSGRYLSWLKTDSEGRFKFRALPQGYDYVLSARKVHYLVGQTEVHSEGVHNNHIDGISIVLPRGRFSVSGVVFDANGKPVPNVWVYCTGKGQSGINSHTDAEGRFKADGIFEGQVDIMASIRGNDGGWLGGNVSVEAGATNVKVVLNNKGIAPPKGRTCFPSETDVWVNGAVVQISEVVRGQTVGKHKYTMPTATSGQVEDIEEHAGIFTCRDIVLENGNRISVVDSHCFMLDSGRWMAAQDLRSGQRLKTLKGVVIIRSVIIREKPYLGKVYNLKVKNSDRYMVGEDGVIVRDY